jgi:hypothetical protein
MTEVDHLVVAADTLAQGAAWCERVLGVSPGPGGRHAFMGTHNRLLRLGGEFPSAYLEIIAIDPDAPDPGRPRWFGLDRPALKDALRDAPRLVQVVARTRQVEMLRWGLINRGIDPGRPLEAERETPEGRLKWRILVRDDGENGCGGVLPTLIEWTGRHPTESMAPSPLRLERVALAGLPAPAADVLRLRGVDRPDPGPADLRPGWRVILDSPRGRVEWESWT